MAKYKIDLDREGCIGCWACISVCGENWIMEEDGKSSAKKIDLEEKELPKNMEAAESCPVNVIHIINKDTDEKLI